MLGEVLLGPHSKFQHDLLSFLAFALVLTFRNTWQAGSSPYFLFLKSVSLFLLAVLGTSNEKEINVYYHVQIKFIKNYSDSCLSKIGKFAISVVL